MAFSGSILFLVPFAGRMLSSIAELVDIGAIVSVVGAVGNTALDIYSVASDPHKVPFAIMTALLDPLAILDSVKVAKMASPRRQMGESDVLKLGDQVKPILDKIDFIKLKSKCAI